MRSEYNRKKRMGEPESIVMDVVLVPIGILIMIIYHSQLLYRILIHPTTTVIGINHINRRAWVHAIMNDGMKNGVLGVQTIRNHIMASSVLATAAIALCSILAIIMSGAWWSANALSKGLLLSHRTPHIVSSIKLLCMLACFLVAFLCHVQSIRYYSHASFLISIPRETTIITSTGGFTAIDYVLQALRRGSDFWSLGLRAFYFSFPIFLWMFGPISMFICALVLVSFLHFLDTANKFKQTLHGSHNVSNC